jgi:hypothetical protein
MRFSGSLSEQLSRGPGNAGLNQSAGGSQVIEYLVQPQEFTMLRTGGKECDMQVDGIIFQGGRRWIVPTKEAKKVQNFIRHVFPQVYG